jgi:Na+-driven multidrug efflux pump
MTLVPSLLLLGGATAATTLIFGIPAAGSESISLVTRILCLQVPLQIGGLPMVKALHALRMNHFVTWIGIAGWVLNVVLNGLLGRIWGLPGIAASTVLVYLTTTFIMLRLLGRHQKLPAERGSLPSPSLDV